jgi:hypothetical protein
MLHLIKSGFSLELQVCSKVQGFWLEKSHAMNEGIKLGQREVLTFKILYNFWLYM